MSNGSAKKFVWAFCVAIVLQWLLCETPTATGAMNVLAVQSVSSKSRWNVMRATLRALTDRGHNVTVFTPYLDGERAYYNEVEVNYGLSVTNIDINYIINNFVATNLVFSSLMNRTRAACNLLFQHPRMMDILQHGPTAGFDVFVTDPLMSECMSYVATKLHVPLIYVFPPPIVTYMERTMFGHVANPAVVAHIMSRHSTPKTFTERLANTLLTVHCSILMWYYDRQNRLSDPQPYDHVDLVKPSVTFSNTHFITEPSRPLTPDIVQVGGVHLSQPKGGMPKDILEFIEDSPHGVIYFTFGSIVLMSSLPENIQNAFKDVFAQVPHRVLWKYEGEMKDKPKNVMTKRWFPQRDVLLHPNVKLFISHGGISGVYEAVDGGVPILGFPFFYDQPKNLRNLVDVGMAISMDLFSINNDTLLKAVLGLVNDKRYQINAKVASDRFKDRPMSPAESVVYWTEYVVRHKGAPHLKSHAINLMWYEYFLVDVIVTFLFVFIIVLFIIFYGLKLLYLYIFKYFHNVKRKRD